MSRFMSYGTKGEKAISLSQGIHGPNQVNEHIAQFLNHFDLRQHLLNTSNSLLEKSVEPAKVIEVIEAISNIALVTNQLRQVDAMLNEFSQSVVADFVDDEVLNINNASLSAPQPGMPNRDVRMSCLDELHEVHSDLFPGSKGELTSLIGQIAGAESLTGFCELVESNVLGPKYQKGLLQDYVSTLSNEEVQKLSEQNELLNNPKPTPH